ncbi:putative ribonuclease E [Sphingobium sp. SYK-6]|uniref:Rne/Rng family ribonuclease n=1 Tax=Sphingobium sp. (strain NBRC 103272 / SYK-6) TaxID=627192 RepID=UPI0002277CC0|nr:ribonuclease E/G [Sphingobium sp. SYK-6]BAK68310.1 putative ribonuclease E [Sphingobium sp. SYK-6]
MTMRMLIDARHREETRVAVVTGNRIEEFDFESAEHKQLKGNIYLAKVTRVEPSLQAAFVDYGGNRHGFLAFSEIHPDYYQIPREDREALLAEEAAHAAEEAALRAEDDDEHEGGSLDSGDVEVVERPDLGDDEDEDGEPSESASGGQGGKADNQAADEIRRKRMALRRRYKIQDVIRRRQVLLVQVVKEERGNKGAALTTYLSLAGRYCVLMPNTSHGGGISRKISNSADRKRLKSIIADMNLPSTMGCIVRTAGLSRTKTEIRRDFDYLARLWDEIRDKTLKSAAPALIHNDSDLIKRAIRDIYHRDIEEVIVEGEEGYRAAKDFMKLLMPSHARRVKQYADVVSLFQRFGVEDQLAAMYNPVVQLKSGGYLVINPTEALVSIDINSGRSTREHNIEQTATATNLEAAREIARQLRLRDMAGLVVIDFIDMEHNSNIRKVEKAMKEALKDDRARIQVGRISGFGLMEMSRQRLRTGVLEASTRACPHCEGTGLVRTASSAGLSALRMLEEEAARGRGSIITLRASQEAAFYVLNNKRRELGEIENRYGVTIVILPDGEVEGARMSVEASGPRPTMQISYAPIVEDVEEEDDFVEEEDAEEEEAEEADESARPTNGDQGEGRGKRKRRRRGRRGRRDGEEGASGAAGENEAEGDASEDAGEEGDREVAQSPAETAEGGEDAPRRSRRGRRGGRRRRGNMADQGSDATVSDEAHEPAEAVAPEAAAESEAPAAEPVETPVEAEEPVAPRRRRRSRAAAPATEAQPVEDAAEAAPEAEAEVVAVELSPELVEAAETPEVAEKPKRRSRKKAVPAAGEAPAEAPAEEAAPEAEKPAPKRRTRSKAAAAKAAPAEAVSESVAPEAPAEPAAEAPATDGPAAEAQAAEAQEAGPAISAQDDVALEDGGSEEPPRRGWWQRTFGA